MVSQSDGQSGCDEGQSTNTLFELTYGELKRLAGSMLVGESQPQTLQATALVNEAYLKLAGDRIKPWANKRHFFCTASEAMRRILIDQARKRASSKRGGLWKRTEFPETGIEAPSDSDAILEVHEVLKEFEAIDPQKAELVSLRFFGGLPLEDVARLTGISLATAKRHWRYARAWLLARMGERAGESDPKRNESAL